MDNNCPHCGGLGSLVDGYGSPVERCPRCNPAKNRCYLCKHDPENGYGCNCYCHKAKGSLTHVAPEIMEVAKATMPKVTLNEDDVKDLLSQATNIIMHLKNDDFKEALKKAAILAYQLRSLLAQRETDGTACTCAEFVQSVFDPNRCAVCRKSRPAA